MAKDSAVAPFVSIWDFSISYCFVIGGGGGIYGGRGCGASVGRIFVIVGIGRGEGRGKTVGRGIGILDGRGDGYGFGRKGGRVGIISDGKGGGVGIISDGNGLGDADGGGVGQT